ncbi:MAG TPA: hypothetical protein QGH10_21055, partial [Armatimonadota bacterium]|nr:hypothetical protein [Armatimonadota bacterium]
HKNDLEDDLSVSFDRPDLSPCLADLPEGDVRRAEALAIIEAGSAALAERPRADMAGFAPAGPDAGRQEKYDRLEQLAMDTLEAMRLGHRVRGGTQATGGY